MSLAKFINPVPTKVPDDASVDHQGRQWCKAPKQGFYMWKTTGNLWFVWFRGKNKTLPTVREYIYMDDRRYQVRYVWCARRSSRGVIEFY
jgi:hypothetical protein